MAGVGAVGRVGRVGNPHTSGGVGPAILLTTDMKRDSDDAGAVALLMGAQRQGRCRLVAAACSPTTTYGAAALQSFLNYNGCGDVPIGVDSGIDADAGNWLSTVASTYGLPQLIAGTYPSSVSVLRQALASSTRTDNIILVTGGQGALSDLLQSSADGISGLTGSQLVAAKCARVVIMGGDFPTSASQETNIGLNRTAAIYVAANCPVPIYYDGFSVGAGIKSGPDKSLDVALNPYRKAYVEAVADGMTIDANDERESWDPSAALFAVQGVQSIFSIVGPGTVTINASTGNTSFSAGAGTHYYITRLDTAANARLTINALIAAADNPAISLGAPAVPVAGTIGSTSASVVVGRVNGALSYQYSLNGGAWQDATVSAATPTTVTLSISGLSASTGYDIQIRAKRFAATGGASPVLHIATGAAGPSDMLFLGAKLKAWYYPATFTAALWPDSSGNGVDASAAGANQPSVSPAGGARFDAATQRMACAISAVAMDEVCYVVCTVPAMGGSNRTLLGSSADSGRQLMFDSGGNIFLNKQNAANVDGSGSPQMLTSKMILRHRMLGTTGSPYSINGGADFGYSSATALAGVGTTIIGAVAGGGNSLYNATGGAADIHEVLICTGGVTGGDEATIIANLKSRHGIA